MSDQSKHIPVIDFAQCGLQVLEEGLQTGDVSLVGQLLKEAFSTVGFCYLKNHGIDQQLVDKYMAVSRNFFEQSVEDKMKHATKVDSYYGWIAVEREKLNPERPGDLKEAFNFNPADDSDDWSDVEFQQTSMDMFQRCTELSQRICDALSVGIGLRRSFLRDAHKFAGKKGSATTLRSLYYPPIPEGSPLKPGQIRAGEHSDYGSISLVFQDDIGGLEANIHGTGYVPASPISGTVLVNIGDLLQRWTSDKLLATKHRVVVPENEIGGKKCRQSIVFFFYPDYDYLIKCVDGSDKYDPITGLDYLKYRYSITF
ncbi:uncharacterized protein LOC128203756 [Mya arenaria]|nr:uncharacterized protein LOC128203756 [Mya arenaria]